MTFVYKIWSKYDGFTPARISERLQPPGLLELAWKRYLDEVDTDDQVWLHFRGHGGPPSIYARGLVDLIDRDRSLVWVKVLEHATSPLVDGGVGTRIESLVSATRAQVFAIEPDEFGLTPPDVACDRIGGPATTCAERRCDDCPMWWRFEIVRAADLRLPSRMRKAPIQTFAPGLWVRPKRQPRYPPSVLRPDINEATNLFQRFKAGEENVTYPLALAAYKALRRRRATQFDGIVAIPLSPEKKRAKELDRCAGLAREMARLLNAPVFEALSLSSPISKRRMSTDPATFERAYAERLEVDRSTLPRGQSRILLVDDVCTHGSTLATAARALAASRPRMEIVAVTAAQMILVESVRNPTAVTA